MADGTILDCANALTSNQFEKYTEVADLSAALMENVMKLDIKAFALTCGIISGVALPLLTWWVMATSSPSTPLLWLTHVYRGYSLTLIGSLIGAVWAFFDGLIGGALFAWLYDVIGGRLLTQRRVVG